MKKRGENGMVMKTFIAALAKFPPPLASQAFFFRPSVQGWLTTTLNRFPPVALAGRPTHERVHAALLLRDMTYNAGVSLNWTLRFVSTQARLMRVSVERPRFGMALSDLCRMRTKGFWDTRRLAQIGKVPLLYLQKCPMCGAAVPETVAHYIVKCARWTADRQILLGFLDYRLAGATDEEVLTFLLGGGKFLGGPVLDVAALAAMNVTAEHPWPDSIAVPVLEFISNTRHLRWARIFAL